MGSRGEVEVLSLTSTGNRILNMFDFCGSHYGRRDAFVKQPGRGDRSVRYPHLVGDSHDFYDVEMLRFEEALSQQLITLVTRGLPDFSTLVLADQESFRKRTSKVLAHKTFFKRYMKMQIKVEEN